MPVSTLVRPLAVPLASPVVGDVLRGPLLVQSALVNLDESGLTGAATITAWANADTDYSQATSIGTAANIKRIPSGASTRVGAGGGYLTTGTESFTGDWSMIWDITADDWSDLTGFMLENRQSGEGFNFGTSGGTWQLEVEDGSALDTLQWTEPAGLSDASRHTVRLDWEDGVGATLYIDGVIHETQKASTKTPNDTARIFRTGWQFGSTYSFTMTGALTRSMTATDYVSGTSFTSGGNTWTLTADIWIQNTGYDGYVNVGSAGFESAAGQDLATYTFVDVMRFTKASPSANQTIVGSRSDTDKLFEIYTDNSNSNKLTVAAGGTPVAHTDAYDTDWHVISFVQRGGATSALSIDGVAVTGDPGTDTWDYGSMDVDEAGATSAPVIRAQRLVFNRALTNAELEDLRIYLTRKFGL